MFGVTGLATDTSRLNSYLDAVSLAEANEILTLSPGAIDSLQGLPAAAVISVKETSGKVHELRMTTGETALLNGADGVRLGRNTLQVMMTGWKRLTMSKTP